MTEEKEINPPAGVTETQTQTTPAMLVNPAIEYKGVDDALTKHNTAFGALAEAMIRIKQQIEDEIAEKQAKGKEENKPGLSEEEQTKLRGTAAERLLKDTTKDESGKAPQDYFKDLQGAGGGPSDSPDHQAFANHLAAQEPKTLKQYSSMSQGMNDGNKLRQEYRKTMQEAGMKPEDIQKNINGMIADAGYKGLRLPKGQHLDTLNAKSYISIPPTPNNFEAIGRENESLRAAIEAQKTKNKGREEAHSPENLVSAPNIEPLKELVAKVPVTAKGVASTLAAIGVAGNAMGVPGISAIAAVGAVVVDAAGKVGEKSARPETIVFTEASTSTGKSAPTIGGGQKETTQAATL